jgi:hypothetical protein
VIFLLGIVLWVFTKSKTPLAFILAQVLVLLPVLGVIAAPFMRFSIVSEQHLYLALPFALCFQLWLIDHFLPLRARIPLLASLGLLLLILTTNYNQTFKNDERFFLRVLRHYPLDRLAVLSLANHYRNHDQNRRALKTIKEGLQHNESFPYLDQDPMHPYLMRTKQYLELKQFE